MAPRGLSLGFFGLFGRSPELRELDKALRAADLHPNLVPEAVKLTAVKLLMEEAGDRDPTPQAYQSAAELIAFCILGTEGFGGANGDRLVSAVGERIEAALEAGNSLDAKLVLLMLHAKVIQPSVGDQFGLESASE
ncbi:MAG: hypothetical protein ACREDO_12210 [Methyloceanibacter sp.]